MGLQESEIASDEKARTGYRDWHWHRVRVRVPTLHSSTSRPTGYFPLLHIYQLKRQI